MMDLIRKTDLFENMISYISENDGIEALVALGFTKEELLEECFDKEDIDEAFEIEEEYERNRAEDLKRMLSE